MLKGHHRQPVAAPEAATSYFGPVMEQIFDGDPRYVRRLVDLWDGVAPRAPKARWFYPVVWDYFGAGELRFALPLAHPFSGRLRRCYRGPDGTPIRPSARAAGSRDPRGAMTRNDAFVRRSGRGRWLALVAGLLSVLAGLTAAACGRGDGPVATELRFEWRAGEGFRGQVSMHEAFRDQPQAETLSYRDGGEPRMGPEIADGILRPKMGEVAKFLVVVTNPTDEPLRFWVTPHLPSPYSAERGLVIHCLCTGQQYEVPPRGVWTRVIEAGLIPEGATRGPVVLTHAFIAGEVPEAQ